MAVNMLNQMIQIQQNSSNTNKDELILLIKTKMVKLIE
jgi:aminopeptidase N